MSKNEGGIITIEDITCMLSFDLGKWLQLSGEYGAPKTIYGTIAIGLADNPASNALCSFKAGFTAFCHSRQCMGTSEECKNEVSRTPRTPSN